MMVFDTRVAPTCFSLPGGAPSSPWAAGWIPHRQDSLQGVKRRYTVAGAHKNELGQLELNHECQAPGTIDV